MRLARKLRRLGWADRCRVAVAVPVLLATRAALATLPLPVVLRLAPEPGAAPRVALPPGLRRSLWALQAVGNRLFPGRPCLPVAVSAHLLCRRRGYPSELRIGVRRDGGAFQAHAWVELEGTAIVGDTGSLGSFVALERPAAPDVARAERSVVAR